jgi:APA family basic amino acid/polyamine antiporter
MASVKKPVFVRDATGLTRQISAMTALGMALNGMGMLYVFNAVVYNSAYYPLANPLVFAFTGLLLILPVAGMNVLMSVAMPRTGGDYVWVSRIFTPSIGFTTNFVIAVINLSFIGVVTPQAVQWSAAEMFYDLGKIYGNQSYIDVANYLQGATPTFWYSVALVIIAGVIVMASLRLSAAIVRLWVFLTVGIAAIFIITVLYAGTSTFITNFNSLSGANYNDVITAGQEAGAYGGIPPVLSSSTLYAGVLGLLGYLGFNTSVYFGGEVKNAQKTQILANLGGAIIFAIFTTTMIAVEYFGEGPAFANAMATLWVSGSEKLPYISIPLASGMSMFWTQNPFLVSLFNLSYGINIEIMNITILFTTARCLFAWSFDRMMPTSFADLNSRTHTPVNATAIMVIISVIYTYVAVYQFGLLESLFSYGTAGTFIAYIIVSIAAIFFPYRRKDIFDVSPTLVKRKIVGVPLVSILGVISLMVSLIVLYAIILPVMGSFSFLTVFLEGIVPTFIIGAILYGIVWLVRKRQGVDLSLIQKTIPPE